MGKKAGVSKASGKSIPHSVARRHVAALDGGVWCRLRRSLLGDRAAASYALVSYHEGLTRKNKKIQNLN